MKIYKKVTSVEQTERFVQYQYIPRAPRPDRIASHLSRKWNQLRMIDDYLKSDPPRYCMMIALLYRYGSIHSSIFYYN